MFEGPAFHTARWPGDLDLTGKRVAVIGSGCSSYQMMPELVKMAEHTYLFQRTPSWCFDVAGYRSPYAPQVNWLDRNLPYFTNFARFRASWLNGPGEPGCRLHRRSCVQGRAREKRHEQAGSRLRVSSSCNESSPTVPRWWRRCFPSRRRSRLDPCSSTPTTACMKPCCVMIAPWSRMGSGASRRTASRSRAATSTPSTSSSWPPGSRRTTSSGRWRFVDATAN